MHWIERHILKQLAFDDSKRYSELKPESDGGNLFQFHATKLMKEGLVERSRDGYSLTKQGKIYVADLSQARDMRRRRFPRIVVGIVVRNSGGELLLFRWRRQPYRGKVSIPFGRHHIGLSYRQTAMEQLRDKTGLSAEFRHLGDAYLITRSGDEVIDHLLMHVVEARKLTGELGSDGLTGASFWSEPVAVPKSERLPGLDELLAWADNPKRDPLIEITVQA